MVDTGLVILMSGMAVVFAFLALMVLVMRLSTLVIGKYFSHDKESSVATLPAHDDNELAVALAVANYPHALNNAETALAIAAATMHKPQ